MSSIVYKTKGDKMMAQAENRFIVPILKVLEQGENRTFKDRLLFEIASKYGSILTEQDYTPEEGYNPERPKWHAIVESTAEYMAEQGWINPGDTARGMRILPPGKSFLETYPNGYDPLALTKRSQD